eukprot:7381934-Pyramimonas_sp.AAC.1
MGAAETRDHLMICPNLEDHFTPELRREASAMKERRKLREERASARTGGRGGGKGGAGGDADGRHL